MPRSVTIEGFDQVTKALEQLDAEVVGKGARGPIAQATRATLAPVRKTAETKAPEGLEGVTSDDPGRLKRNIRIRRITKPERYGMRNGELYEVYVRSSRNKPKDDKNNAWYWHFVEFGTSKQAAQPFLRPALSQYRAGMPMVWTREFMKRFERIQRKMERDAK